MPTSSRSGSRSGLTRSRVIRLRPVWHTPTTDPRVLLAAVGSAVEQAATDLLRRQGVARGLRLILRFEPPGRGPRVFRAKELALPTPTSDERILFRAARGLLARLLAHPEPVGRMTVELTVAPTPAPQLPLFRAAALPEPGPLASTETIRQRLELLRRKLSAGRGAA